MKQKILIGRRPTCDICLPFPNISSQHCELEIQNGYWHIQDLGSSNGLKINGLRQESKFLHPGDELFLAKHGFEIRYEPLTDGPPPEDDDPFKLSLMEKAGLVNKRKRKKANSSHGEDLMGDAAPQILPPKKKSASGQDDDQIMQWLSDD